ncbi:DUF805 domain-containing protein [Novosphingobium album (ex Liu et al. 2023)]|uniref:DUF805 domain-containing protein n=1 Tax=Novosphingobium album (ex Liu et al. 2023) TaxID=3031130 RepID=A0ABT5WPG9_9SPHN|nr:hypothetical protein [Novosphingobium album (ex Liu et al. 2023)]MDE8651918.1 hypothetical protein [Novosphingobium album (ex Liu et al. 2023)]
MPGAVRYGLTNLVNFSGRDARQTFWFFVLFLYIVTFMLGSIRAFPHFHESQGRDVTRRL